MCFPHSFSCQYRENGKRFILKGEVKIGDNVTIKNTQTNKQTKKNTYFTLLFSLVKIRTVRSTNAPHCWIKYSQLFFRLCHPVESHLSSMKWWAQDGLVVAGIPSQRAPPLPPWHRKDFVWSHPVGLQEQEEIIILSCDRYSPYLWTPAREMFIIINY